MYSKFSYKGCMREARASKQNVILSPSKAAKGDFGPPKISKSEALLCTVHSKFSYEWLQKRGKSLAAKFYSESF